MNVHRTAIPAILTAGALTAPAAAVAHTPQPTDRARIAAYLEPVRVAPTAEQAQAILAGVEIAHQHAAAAGWTDQCAGVQQREIHANLNEQATAAGYTYSVTGLAWWWECRWAIRADLTGAAARCAAAHEESHGIRGDGWHSPDPTSPLYVAAGGQPVGCLPLARRARHELKRTLTNPRRWKISRASVTGTTARMTARKRRTGTRRAWTATLRHDGTIRLELR